MSPELVTADRIAVYREEGAVCVPGAFRDWVEPLLAAHDRLQRKLEDACTVPLDAARRSAKLPNPPGFPPLQYSRDRSGHFGIRHAVFHDEIFGEWLRRSPAAEIVGRVIGASHVRFWWDQSFCKEGDRPEAATPWHSDIGAFSFMGQQLPSFWIALTDVDLDNAPLLTVVASHRDPRMFRPVFGAEGVPLPEGYAELELMREQVSRSDKQIRTWPVQAGDCLLIHPYTWHASLPRKAGAGRRIAFTSRWFGDDVVWRKRAVTFNYPDDPRCAKVMQDSPPPDEGFPIVWRRSAD